MEASHERHTQSTVLSEERDTKIIMDEKAHVYYVAEVKCNTSATGFKSRLYNHFDVDKVSTQQAKRRDMDLSQNDKKAYVQSEWKRAAEFGTAVHKRIEYWLTNKHYEPSPTSNWIETTASKECRALLESNYPHDIMNEQVEIRFNSFLRFFNIFFSKYELCAAEYMIYGDIKGEVIPGTIDALFWSDKEKREVIIVDWKSNKGGSIPGFKSSVENQESPFYKQKKDMRDQYFCQLHIYSYILETYYNCKVTASLIVHLSDNNTWSVYEATQLPCICVT